MNLIIGVDIRSPFIQIDLNKLLRIIMTCIDIFCNIFQIILF